MTSNVLPQARRAPRPTLWRRLESRPPWPPRPLLDLAAGFEPESFELTRELVAIAADHRMSGLLWSWAQDHAPEGELRSYLAMSDLRTQARLRRIWDLLEACVLRLSAAGIEAASIKGPITEARWYSRPGERPSIDVDLWLSPHQIDRAGEALAILQPDHPWTPFFGELAASGLLQTATLKVDGIEVDLHLDLLKTGVPTLQSREIWEATERFTLPGGTVVRVLDPSAALLHFLVHLNKDRFQKLLGYADVARIVDGGIDWNRLVELAQGEGLLTSVACSLAVVNNDLGRDRPPGAPTATGLPSQLWHLVWPPRIRLRGSEGRRRFRKRQLLLPALANRPVLDVSRAFSLELVPPEPVLEARASRNGKRPSEMRRWTAALLHRRRQH